MKHQIRYLSWLLRIWQEYPGKAPRNSRRQWRHVAPLWRASLESPGSHELQRFASLADLFAFLEEQMGSRSPESGRHAVEETGLAAEE
jgi:hypothetical protein